VRERLIDAIAAKTGIDAIAIRRRNFIAKSAMPYSLGFGTLGTDIIYDSGDYAKLTDKLLAAADWPAMQRDLKGRRAAGEKVGAGFAMFVEKSGLGPFDKVRIEVAPSGAVDVVTGVASIGQGVETALAQIAAETLGVDYKRIKVTHGQTNRIDKGLGAFASRVTVMCGEATRMAAVKLREAALAAAAELMQTAPDALDIIDGEIVRTGKPGPSMQLGALAARPEGLTAEAEFKSSQMVYPYGAHVVQLKVDVDTGGVTIERYLVAFDIGKAVNPMLVEGQIIGGMAQGLGGALYEEFLYAEDGEPLSVTFADYLMPTAHEVPGVEVIVTEDAPSPLNTYGFKGAGEGGITPVGAAIASAIDDALQRPGAVTQLPITPQRLKALLAAR
jgi:CO/xanthine dehydrogenase Mo-binding subunit